MKKIAVIEDNHDMRENIQEILELADYKVVTAANGKEGVELVKKELPDLIICDIMMPELDGYGVLYYLSKVPATSAIPFIFLTAKTERSDMRKGMNMGADDYIAKPFDEVELLEAVESRLKKRRMFLKVDEQANKWESFKSVAADFAQLEELKSKAVEKVYSKKEPIYNEGDSPKFLFHVIEGHVRNYKVTADAKELATGLYGPNDFFGYTELLTNQNYMEYSVAIEGAKLSLIPREEFELLLLSNKDISINFIKLLAGNIIDKENDLVNLAYNTVRKRVADALTKLYDKYKGKYADRVEISVSRDELASLVGTATESVIRILSEFKNDGYITSKGSLITIMQIDELRNYKY